VFLLITAFLFDFLRGKDRPAGIWLALAASVKVYPIFLLVPVAGVKRFRAILSFAIAIGAIHLILLPFIGIAAFREWIEIGIPFARKFLDNPVNLSLPAYFDRLIGPVGGYRDPVIELPLLANILDIGIPIGGLALMYLAARRSKPEETQLSGVLGLSLAVLMLTEAITWGHYLIVLAFPLAWIGFNTSRRQRAGALFPIAIVFLAGFEAATRFVNSEAIERLRNISPWTEGLLPVLGMALLALLMWRDLSTIEA
jgi:hypothetical protein